MGRIAANFKVITFFLLYLLVHPPGVLSWGSLTSPQHILYPKGQVAWPVIRDPLVGHTAEEWRNRTVYQLLIDRFSTDTGVGGWCDLTDYCGGTFRGIINRLDYIAGMGFDAIWISPVVENAPTGYHGFWPTNLYNISPEFQGAEELKELVRACHARDMWVAVDVVANHMGGPTAGDMSTLVPFNEPKHYHPCYTDCCGDCGVCNYGTRRCQLVDPFTVEHCRLAPSLLDLNQEDPEVAAALIAWVKWLLHEFQFDALRFDAAKHVGRPFWRQLKEATGGVFHVGEVVSDKACFLSQYQSEGLMDSLLSHPMAFAIGYVFERGASMRTLSGRHADIKRQFSDHTVLWNFIDNHNMPRFLARVPSVALLKGALVWVLMGEGIPVVYYGTEQGFQGTADPDNREPLWWSGFNTDSELYKFIALINKLRRDHNLHSAGFTEALVEDELYAFTRGSALVVLTNDRGIVNYRLNLPSQWGGIYLCNAFFKPPTDCFFVPKGGEAFDVFMVGGEPKVYVPHQASWPPQLEDKGGMKNRKMDPGE